MSKLSFIQRESTTYSYNESTPQVYQVNLEDIEALHQNGTDYVNILLTKEMPFNNNVNRSVLHVTTKLGTLNKRMEMIKLISSLEPSSIDEETQELYEVLTTPFNHIEKVREYEGIFFSDAELSGYETFCNRHDMKNEEKQVKLKSLFEKVKISAGTLSKARREAKNKI
jgi:hypothetical protein